MNQIKQNIKHINEAIKICQEKLNLRQNVKLIAVSKFQSIDKIKLAIEAGQEIFGENRVQESLQKWTELKQIYPKIKLHLIGGLQTNKVKEALEIFDVIQTVDRKKLVDEIVKYSDKFNEKEFFIQVNIGEEEQKNGVDIDGIQELLIYCNEKKLKISGLMCIPPQDKDPTLYFALLAKLASDYGLTELSMGMSGDFEQAIKMGATYIRIGTRIFGERI